MALTPGARLGPYEIVAPLGAGGMGEVYRAKDTRLRRDVAIKVLPASVAQDEERLRRFEQEALATAALNHPNILVVYDIGKEADTAFVVEELLEGRTLREVIDAGAVPLRKAVDYAAQIAHGLAAAHGKGIVHRDLKPENLFVTADDRLKILDFGLAKVAGSRAASGATNTVLAVGTEPGMVLGTVGYMAPEQVRGVAVDHRADIFSFGAVLYELLTSRRAFTGETAADTMTAILKDAPAEITDSGRVVPSGLARVVERCLEKQPAARFQSASDLAFALQALGSDARSGSGIVPVPAEVSVARNAPTWLLAAVALIGGVALASVAWRALAPPAPPPPLVALDVAAPPGYVSGRTNALSPDGTRIAFPATDAGGKTRLWVRTLTTGDLQMIEGIDDVREPFWSPDGQSIGSFGGGRLRVVDLAHGGRVRIICDVDGVRVAGTWNQHDVILFATEGGVPLQKVAADGRTAPVPLPGIIGFRPFFLPDGRHFVFSKPGGGVYLGDLESRTPTMLIERGDEPKFAAGHLLFIAGTQLMAQPFNPSTLVLSGEAHAIVEIGRFNPVGSNFSVAGNALVAFTPETKRDQQLVWHSRDGARINVVDDAGSWSNPELSPDDALVAGERIELGGASEVWLHDVARGTSRTFASGLPRALTPTWSRDGSRVRFHRIRPDAFLVEKPLEGGAEQPMVKNVTGASGLDGNGTFTGIASDDAFAIGFSLVQGHRAIFALPLRDALQESIPFAPSPADETQPSLSPDGRWLAYVSNTQGNRERDILIEAFPRGGKKVNASGPIAGMQPRWRKDGRELFYLANDQRLIAVPVEEAGDALRLGPPRPLFQTSLVPQAGLGTRAEYDVTRDGQRFILAEPRPGSQDIHPIRVIVNWISALIKERGDEMKR